MPTFSKILQARTLADFRGLFTQGKSGAYFGDIPGSGQGLPHTGRKAALAEPGQSKKVADLELQLQRVTASMRKADADHAKEIEALRAQLEDLKLAAMIIFVEQYAAYEQINNLIAGQRAQPIDLPTKREFKDLMSKLEASITTSGKRRKG